MISVSEALDALFALANPLEIETVPLSDAAGRVLAVPAAAEIPSKASRNAAVTSPTAATTKKPVARPVAR